MPFHLRTYLLRTAVALLTLAALPVAAEQTSAHSGNPNFRSTVRTVQPHTLGLTAEVLNFDDRVLLINKSAADVTVLGYDSEPYLRFLSSGVVELNTVSPAAVLNDSRFVTRAVPKADAKRPPMWKTVAQDGRYEWHDHRMHWMSKSIPTAVHDQSKRTKVFGWQIPLRVDGKRGAISGDLYWQPSPSGSIPIWAIAALLALVALVGIATILRRRRGSARTEAW